MATNTNITLEGFSFVDLENSESPIVGRGVTYKNQAAPVVADTKRVLLNSKYDVPGFYRDRWPTIPVEIDWDNPLTKGLCFAWWNGYNYVDKTHSVAVTSWSGTKTAKGIDDHGPYWESNSLTDGGWSTLAPTAHEKLAGSAFCSIVLGAAMKDHPSYGSITLIPHTDDNPWGSPYMNIAFHYATNVSQVGRLFWSDGADAFDDERTSGNFWTDDDEYHAYAVGKTDRNNISFFRDGNLFESPSAAANTSAITLNTQHKKIFHLSRNETADGEGSQGRLYFDFWFNRELTLDEHRELAERPWQIFKPKAFSSTYLAPTPATKKVLIASKYNVPGFYRDRWPTIPVEIDRESPLADGLCFAWWNGYNYVDNTHGEAVDSWSGTATTKGIDEHGPYWRSNDVNAGGFKALAPTAHQKLQGSAFLNIILGAKIDSLDGYGAVAAIPTSDTSFAWPYFLFNYGQHLSAVGRLFWNDSAGDQDERTVSSTYWSTDGSYHAYSLDKNDTNDMSFYKDGDLFEKLTNGNNTSALEETVNHQYAYLMARANDGDDGAQGNIYFCFWFNRQLSPDEHRILSERPWEIFKPKGFNGAYLISGGVEEGGSSGANILTLGKNIARGVLRGILRG